MRRPPAPAFAASLLRAVSAHGPSPGTSSVFVSSVYFVVSPRS